MVMAKVVMHVVILATVMTAMATRKKGDEGITFANCELTMALCIPYIVSLDLTKQLCMSCRSTPIGGMYVISFSVHMGRPTPAKLLLLWECVAKSVKEESAHSMSVNPREYFQGLLPFLLFKQSFNCVIFLYFFRETGFSIFLCGRTG